MKRYSIIKFSIAFLISSTVFSTTINILLLGTTDRTFFPVANFFIVALLWLFRGFGSLLTLAIGLILYFCLVICLIRLLLKKPVRTLLISIYVLDMVGVLYLLVNRQGADHAISLLWDICILWLSSRLQAVATTKDISSSHNT